LQAADSSSAADAIDPATLFAMSPAPMLVVATDAPRFTITHVNDAYLAAVMRTRDELVGRGVFEALPDNPDDPNATGVANLRASIERAIATGRPDKMPVQKYDVPRPNGGFEERWWDPVNAPVLNACGKVAGVIHQVEDATERERAAAVVRANAARQAFRLTLEERLRGPTEPTNFMNAAVEALGRHLGANRVGYGEVLAGDATVRLSNCYVDGAEPLLGDFPLDGFGPANIMRQRRGESVVCNDVAADPDYDPAVWAAIDTRAFASVPLIRDGRFTASLYVNRRAPHRWTADELALIEEVAARTWAAVERARAEAAQRADEERLRRAHVAGRLGDFTWDVETDRITLAGDYPRMLGLPLQALPRSAPAFFALIHPDDRRHVEAEAAPMLAGGARRFETEYRVVRGDGSVAWIAASAEGEGRLPDGRAARIVGVNFDITEQRRAAERLSESEARFRNMADHAPVMTWVTDPTGFCTYLNRRWYEFTGQTPEQAEGFGWLEATHPDDKADAERVFLEANAKREAFRLEYRLRRADGVYRWAMDAASPRFGEDGEFLGFVGSVIDIDDRREVEERLRESEERYRTLFENIDAAFCLLEVIFDEENRPVDHRFIEVNPAFERQSGMENALGRRAREILPDHEQHWFDTYGRLVETGGSIRFENGSEALGRWFDVHAMRVGEPEQCRVAVLFNDITERKLAEQQLRELNETLERRVAERTAERDRTWRVSQDLLVVINADGGFAAVNQAWTAVLGWAEHELVGTTFMELAHPDDVAPTVAKFEETFTTPLVEPYEYRLRHKDGGYRWLAWTAAVEGGRVFANGRDVTAERARQAEVAALEAARRKADALYRAYFENTAEALFVVEVLEDGSFSIEDLNPAHQSSIGLPLADVQGRRIDEVLPPELAAPVVKHYRAAIAVDGVYQYRERFELQGRTTYWDTVLVPVRDDDGRVVRLIGSSRDLTGQVAAEEQLRQSQKMEAMGQLTGGVAHDFNNLLTPIVGSLDMLQRRGLGNEREQRLIGGAMQSAERAKTLVQRLLAFARRQPLQATAVDLPQLVTGMAGLIGSTLGPNIDVRVDMAGHLPPVRADANQLEMALLNLAVNARDAMPTGGLLTIAATRESVREGHRATLKHGHYVRLSVTDTGTGMDAETLARAVEPFFSTKGIGKGTGLGLSMVHGLAAQLGGVVSLTSELGRGTTVDLWLPMSAEPLADDDERPTMLASKARGRALLVDDEELVRMSTADMLADLGFEVVEAGSAEEALRLLQNAPMPDVLVTDHLMPGMSGADLAREARLMKPDLPILIVSGYAEVEGIAPDLPRLTKPFRNAELAERLADLGPAIAMTG
jgi:PAS domain S-box-containing protein